MTPEQTLEKIEKRFNYLRLEMWRKMEIWEYIAMQINSTEGHEMAEQYYNETYGK